MSRPSSNGRGVSRGGFVRDPYWGCKNAQVQTIHQDSDYRKSVSDPTQHSEPLRKRAGKNGSLCWILGLKIGSLALPQQGVTEYFLCQLTDRRPILSHTLLDWAVHCGGAARWSGQRVGERGTLRHSETNTKMRHLFDEKFWNY